MGSRERCDAAIASERQTADNLQLSTSCLIEVPRHQSLGRKSGTRALWRGSNGVQHAQHLLSIAGVNGWHERPQSKDGRFHHSSNADTHILANVLLLPTPSLLRVLTDAPAPQKLKRVVRTERHEIKRGSATWNTRGNVETPHSLW